MRTDRIVGSMVIALACSASAVGAAAPSNDFFSGEHLTALQRFEAFPYVDRGLREQAAGHVDAAAAAFLFRVRDKQASQRIHARNAFPFSVQHSR